MREGEQADPRGASRAATAILAFACVAAVVLVIPSATGLGYDRFALPKELLVAIAPLLAGVLALLAPAPLCVTRIGAALCGFLVASAAGLALADNQTLAWRAFAVSAGGVVAFLTARRLAGSGHRHALLVAVGAAAVVGAGSVLLEAHGLIPAVSMSGTGPGGTEGNRNYMAHVCVAALPLLLIAASRSRGRIVSLAALLVVAMALVLSRSRGAWLAGGTALVATVALLQVMRTGRPRVAVAVLVCALAAAAAVIVPNQLRWTSDDPFLDTLGAMTEHRRGSGRGRIIQYRNTLSVIAEAPILGVGPGNWSMAYPAHASRGDPSYQRHGIQPVNRMPSSDWLGLVAERGAIGALCIAGAALLIAAACWRALRRESPGSGASADGQMAAVCLATLAGIAVAGAVDAALLRPTPLLIVAVLAGATAPADRVLLELRRSWVGALTASLAVAALVVALRLYPVAEATLHRWRYHALGGVEHMERAASATPDDFRLQMILALDWVDLGRCDRAGERARMALASNPHLPMARSILKRCRR